VLTPAAIERKLRVTATGRVPEQDLDADELAQQCVRLVIPGGPGSGKTWLAKRTARRCAEEALQVLAAGGTLEEAELPLYTTCSRLFGAGGDIREAVVSSALGQLGDLGGSRISAALGVFFTERNAPTLLVIDSLDEAHFPSGTGTRMSREPGLHWPPFGRGSVAGSSGMAPGIARPGQKFRSDGVRQGTSHAPWAHTSKAGSLAVQPRRTIRPWISQPRQRPSTASIHISVRQIRQMVRGR